MLYMDPWIYGPIEKQGTDNFQYSPKNHSWIPAAIQRQSSTTRLETKWPIRISFWNRKKTALYTLAKTADGGNVVYPSVYELLNRLNIYTIDINFGQHTTRAKSPDRGCTLPIHAARGRSKQQSRLEGLQERLDARCLPDKPVNTSSEDPSGRRTMVLL